MVELLFWIWFFCLLLEFKNEKGVNPMADWIVQVVQFHVICCLMSSWAASFMLEIFFRFFLVHRLFTSFGKFTSPPYLSSGPFSLQKRFSYPVFIKTLDWFWNIRPAGRYLAGYFGELRGGFYCQSTWRSGNPSRPRPSKDPPYRKYRKRSRWKGASLFGGMNPGNSTASMGAGCCRRSPSLSLPPLSGYCRPTHHLPLKMHLERDERPAHMQHRVSAMSWLAPHFRSEQSPISLAELDRLVERSLLGAPGDISVIESCTSVVTTATLVDIAMGRPISNSAVDFVLDLIDACGGRCYVMDSVAATELYSSGVWPAREDTPYWSDYDAALLPFCEGAHWRLAVADLASARLYYLDPDEDLTWVPRSYIRDWLSVAHRASQRWCQEIWPAPQQQKGSADCAIAVMAFMLRIARGDGLPIQGSRSDADLSVPPSYTPAQLSAMRTHFFAVLLYARLDPPSDLSVLASDLSALRAMWWPSGSPVTGSPLDEYDTCEIDVSASSTLEDSLTHLCAHVTVTVAGSKTGSAAVPTTPPSYCHCGPRRLVTAVSGAGSPLLGYSIGYCTRGCRLDSAFPLCHPWLLNRDRTDVEPAPAAPASRSHRCWPPGASPC